MSAPRETISDEGLGTLMLGMWVGLVQRSEFPIYIAAVVQHRGADGQVQSVTLTTRSGLKFRCHIELEDD